jgi:hypothetical protein
VIWCPWCESGKAHGDFLPMTGVISFVGGAYHAAKAVDFMEMTGNLAYWTGIRLPILRLGPLRLLSRGK